MANGKKSLIPVSSIIGLAFNILGMLFFSYLFYTRYWKHRTCIEATLSSCLVDDTNLIEGGMVWSVPAAIFAVSTIILLVRIVKSYARAKHTLTKQR